MALFQPAENTSAYLKMGLLGFAGSGKTYTASRTARDFVQYLHSRGISYANKPVMFLDTETGSDWVKPLFEEKNIPLYVAKTRAFNDLMAAVREAEQNASVLIIDSITHFWKELCDSYVEAKAKRLNRPKGRLEFQDWAYLKGEWSKFTDLFVNSNLHIILCGRAGFEYDYFENDEGKKELEKTGVKMKAEGEMGYEPSLLVLMERRQKIESNSVDSTWREATILKDRSTLLDGKTFVNPKFTDFLPHIERLNLGAKQLGVDTSRTTQHDLGPNGRDTGPVQRKIVLGEIQDLLVLHIPGQAAADKQRKVSLLKKHFNAGWVEMEEVMRLSDLRAGYDSLHRELEGVPSRYAAILAPEATTTDMNDELPGDLGPSKSAATKLDENEYLARLEGCQTLEHCVAWSTAVAKDPHLTEEARQRLASALVQQQKAISEAAKPAKPGKSSRTKEKAQDPEPERTMADLVNAG